ncbi:MAG: hypothetical protein AB1758_31075 [Candidatus Eremiobacterota bacterium]
MPTIRILDGLNFEGARLVYHRGIDAPALPVHYRQGDLDRACGPYAVIVALSACGVPIDQKRVLKALKFIAAGDALLSKGTRISDLRRFVQQLDPATSLERVRGTPVEMFACTHVKIWEEHQPVLLCLSDRTRELHHWVVAIGSGFPHAGASEERPAVGPDRLLVLDPAALAPRTSYWNGILTRLRQPGPLRFDYLTEDGLRENVRIDEAYSVVRAEEGW